jgi:HK97 gp10 family phage protein
MSNIQIKVTGLKELQTALKKAPELTVNEIGKAVRKSLETIRTQSLKEAPVNKGFGGGNLRQKISGPRMESKIKGMIVSEAPYSAAVHDGSRPHEIRPKQKKVLANKRTGQFFGQLVHHPGTKPNPFFTRSIEKTKDKVNGYFKKAMDNVLKTLK